MKKACALFVFTLLLSWPGMARAYTQILITEIMYDVLGADTGREWIEVYNSGTTSIDFSSWRLGEGETNHKINQAKGDNIFSPKTFAVIADNPEKFLVDYPDYAGVLFDSTFALSNDGETLSLKDTTLNALHEITYLKDVGAAGDGSSLQKIDTVWHVAMPTPGEENSASGQSGIALQSAPIAKSSMTAIGELVEGEIIIFDLDPVADGQTAWNFGDGTATDVDGSAAEHTYAFAGTYTVVAKYAGNTAQMAVNIAAKPTLAETIEVVNADPSGEALLVTTPEISTDDNEHEGTKQEISSQALAAAAVSTSTSVYPWLLGLCGLAVLAVIATRIIKKQEPPFVVVEDDGIELID